MSVRRYAFYFLPILFAAILIGLPTKSQYFRPQNQAATQQETVLVAGRNVNMVSGIKLPLGDPWLQRQNEPSIAVSSRNPMHLFAVANDYRTIDMSDNYNLRGIPGFSAVRDSWVGVFESFDYGESWVTTLLPGFPQDISAEGVASPIHGFNTACDPIVRAGANGLFYFSGIAFNRSQQAGAVFVARYVDRNNREKVEEDIDPLSGYKKYVGPIEYMGTKLVDTGNSGQFIDMPNMAVDVPRSGAEYGNVYVAYTVFLGDTDINVRSRIVFVKSTNGGVTWSSPIKLTESQHVIQRPVIAIDPSDSTGKTIFVVFRRFANGNVPGGIVFVKSVDGGVSFTKPIDAATLLYPFDQPTTANSFRTNSYPTMAVDGSGVAYLAWAQRYTNGLLSADGQARIVISYLPKGSLTWSAPQIVDYTYTGAGHQFMPTMTFGGGKLMLAWYDQRDDFNLSNAKFIEDGSNHRHTIDVRAAEGMPGPPAVFQPSIPVSRYLFYMELDENGNPIGDLIQGEADFINYPLFELGTKPFHGDYMEIASAPQILPPPATGGTSWIFNTNSPEPTTFPVAWTDNRNVWPPAGNLWGDWIHYNPPTSTQDGDFGQTNPCSYKNNTGMKNQNVYTANLNHGIIVGSPGNTKQLNIKRTFVVFVKNTTNIAKSLQLTISEIGGVGASFDQFNSGKSSLNVVVAPYSSVSTSVYVNSSSSNNFAPVRVDVKEDGPIVGYVILNPDSTNNLILDPEGGNLGNEQHSPKISNPKIFKYDVGNPKEPNASFLGPRAENPRAENSGYVNPRAENAGVKNPRAENPRAENMSVKNENFVNYELKNPRAENPRAENTALTDMTWTVTNDGNTTSAYTFDIRSTVADYFNGDPNDPNYVPPLIAQILVYKVHTVPIDNECTLYQTHADELILNVSNPRAENPRAENIAPLSRNLARMRTSATAQDLNTQDVTFHLAPGEKAEVTLRVLDPDIYDPIAFDTQTVAAETTAEAADTGQTTPPEPVEQPNIPWINPLPTIVAVPSSLSFSVSGTKDILLYLSNLPAGSLACSVSVDSSWLSVLPTIGNLSGTPQTLHVTVNNTSGSYTGFMTVTVPEASNNPLRIPVYLNTGASLPDMVVHAKDSSIPDGGTCNFGSVAPGQYSDVTFTINNNSLAKLNLGGQPIIIITGANANQFSVQQQPTSPVDAGGYTAFTIRFKPTSLGPKTAAISIINNTLDKNPYDITIQGTGGVAPSLVAYYPFNGNANDASGNGNNGIVNGATLTADRFGNQTSAYYFNGDNAYIEVPNSNSLDVTNGLTIVAWVKPTINNIMLPIVTKYRSDEPLRSYWLYGWTSGVPGPRFRIVTTTGNVGEAVTYELLSTTNWSFVAGTFDRTNARLFINGVEKNSMSASGTIRQNSLPLRIGGDDEPDMSYFYGNIDDVRIYNGALSPSEIQALYNQEQGLVAYYPFNGNANDESGNGLNGTPVGALLATDRFGNANSAYSFDGQDDEITVQPNSLLDITGPISLAAWIYPLEQKTQEIVRRSAAAIGPYGLSTSGTGDIIFELSFSGVLQQVRKSGYTLNAWSLIGGTYDGNAMKLYVNGSLVTTKSISGSIDQSPNDVFLIGTRLRQWSNTFHGLLDDIRIYNRELSASEILALYNLEK